MALLSDDTITLRALEPEDLDLLFRWENDTELWSVGAAIAPFSRKQLKDYIDTYDANVFAAGQLRLMIVEKSTGRQVGSIDLYDFDAINLRSAVAILIDRQYFGKGYARRALELLEEYSRERLGLHQLWCIVPEDNEDSRNLFASCSFRISGRLRSWVRTGGRYSDAYLYQKML